MSRIFKFDIETTQPYTGATYPTTSANVDNIILSDVKLFYVGDRFAVEVILNETDTGPDGILYQTQVQSVDGDVVQFLPSIEGLTKMSLSNDTWIVSGLLFESSEHTIYPNPISMCDWKAIRHELIEYAADYDKSSMYSVTGNIRCRTDNLYGNTIDTPVDGCDIVYMNVRSKLHAIIMYMDWLNLQDDVVTKEFMWDQINPDERYNSIEDIVPDITSPLTIEKYIREYVLLWPIADHIVDIDECDIPTGKDIQLLRENFVKSAAKQ